MDEDRDYDPEGGAQSGEGGMTDAEIDATLEESFPASDPPSWTLGTDHQVESSTRPDSSEAPAEELSRDD